MVRIHHAVAGESATTQPPMQWAVPGTLKRISGSMLIANPSGEFRKLLRKFVGFRNVGGHLLASADEKLPKGPEPGPPPAHLDLSLERLHAQQNHKFSRPAQRLQHSYSLERMPEHRCKNIPQPECDTPRTRLSICQDGGEKSHGVRALWITDGFDVRVLVDIDARADGNALREVFRVARRACSDE